MPPPMLEELFDKLLLVNFASPALSRPPPLLPAELFENAQPATVSEPAL